MKFWQWLYKLSKQKVRSSHLEKVGCDMKCPNCNEWFSVSGVESNHEFVTAPDWGYHVKCGKCKHESYWNAIAAPVLLLSDVNGNPI